MKKVAVPKARTIAVRRIGTLIHFLLVVKHENPFLHRIHYMPTSASPFMRNTLLWKLSRVDLLYYLSVAAMNIGLQLALLNVYDSRS